MPARHRGRVLAGSSFSTSFTWNRDMKPFFALYVKEFKAHKILFLFLLILVVGINAYGLIRVANVSPERFVSKENIASDEFIQRHIEISNSLIGIMLPINLTKSILVLSLPFLLAHTCNSEWQSETHYQMFALPVSQYTVILAKVAAVASIGFMGGGIVIGSVYLSMAHVADLLVEAETKLFIYRVIFGVERMLFFDFFLVESLKLATYMIFIFGIVIGMEGVKFSVKRYRRLAAIASFILFLSFGFFILQGLSVFKSSLMPILPFAYSESTIFLKTSVDIYFFSILMGIIFMIIGLVMYEKHAEI